ncbi:MAG: hypothetical protein J5U17_01315 [Candidatus Methanoperedens sp.]|nr:hypothetical protein [Candidatus Methanoperedens sp.]MCE8427268.1 hypothetical protein [Candidatus Methanoperedens sp.]
MSFLIFFFLSFLTGSLVKLTDDIEDNNLNIHRLYAIPGGFAYGLTMGYLMLIDIDASFLFGGVTLGCLITGKIDSRGHYFGISAILTVVFLYGMKLSPLVLLVAIFAALDEIKDVIHVPKFIDFVFEYRLILKFGILILVILKIMGLNALIALFAFDIAYLLTDGMTRRVFV